MIMKKFIALALGASTLAIAMPAAASVTLDGDYISVTINDVGTFSSLKHDPTGTSNYGSNDYITPGTPHDGFSVNSTQTGFRQNDNPGFAQMPGGPSIALVGPAALGYDLAATWTGANTALSITNSYFFNSGDERIRVISTITALSDLTNLAFARSVDPDPDQITFGNFTTDNQRGNSLFGVTDFVGAAGVNTGLTLALVNNSGNTYAHNTQLGSGCCSNINPYTVLGNSLVGGLTSNLDDSLNMAWDLGDLSQGNSLTVEYFYAVGDEIEVVGDPTGAVPEPSTWAMMMLGFGGLGAAMRRRRKVNPALTFA